MKNCKNTKIWLNYFIIFLRTNSKITYIFEIQLLSKFEIQILTYLKSLSLVQLLATPWIVVHGLFSPWNSPGHNTGKGSHSLLQGIFPTQGLNPGLLYCRWILYQLSHKGSPRILEWVVYPFFSGSSQPRNPTRVSRIAGGLYTNWAIREAQKSN